MIPVVSQPEPAGFNLAVRQPGLRWLRRHEIPLSQTLAPNTRLEPYWRRCLDELYEGYGRVCAYLCVQLEREAGGVSVDHYVPKSLQAGLAYEWDNYRLASTSMNARKGVFESVLDPLQLAPDTFRLEMVTGHIFVNPNLTPAAAKKARLTIDRLKLDEPGARDMRKRHYNNYRERHYPAAYLQEYSPFVYAEAERQGLL